MTFRHSLILLAGLAVVASPLAACSPSGAAAGVGATAGVAMSQERGLKQALKDAKIRTGINQNLFLHDTKLFTDVGVEVNEGRVLLTGAVEKPETKLEAVRLAWEIEGVKEVLNEIQVTDEGGIVNYARDVWITNELRARITFDKHVRSINYTIETVNGVIYLMGIAYDKEELDRVTEHARNIKYVRQVISHVRLRKDPRRQS